MIARRGKKKAIAATRQGMAGSFRGVVENIAAAVSGGALLGGLWGRGAGDSLGEMAHRRDHYDRAFEGFLRARRIPYVAVDEARKTLLPRVGGTDPAPSRSIL